jgi:uroporphyrinogen-III decarboxylase
MPPLAERPQAAGRDCFGVLWSLEPGAEGGTFPAHNGHTIRDLAHWRDDLHLPDLDNLDWDSVRREADQIDRDQVLVEGFVELGLFERAYLLLGMEQALIGYLEDEEQMSAMLSAIADYKVELIGRFHEAARLDIIWYGDDWGTQTGLFLPPEVWRRTVRPHTQRIYDAMKSRGILINQHSCGKIEAVFADMVEMGADIWNPCQPCNDLARLKSLFGNRITFCGGIDSQFVLARPGVTTQEVRREVRRRIDELGAGGGYIAAPSHSVPYTPEIMAAMNDEIATYGRAVYRR